VKYANKRIDIQNTIEKSIEKFCTEESKYELNNHILSTSNSIQNKEKTNDTEKIKIKSYVLNPQNPRDLIF